MRWLARVLDRLFARAPLAPPGPRALLPGDRPKAVRIVDETEWARYAAAGYPDDWPRDGEAA